MPAFLVAVGKINLVLSLFVVVYYLVLRKLTYYTINRLFLLFGIVFSCLYPFIDLSNLFIGHESNTVTVLVPQITKPLRVIVEAKTTPFFVPWLYLIFLSGTTWLFLRFIKQGRSLYKIHKASQPAFVDEWPVQLMSEQVGAFSFGRKIYINPTLHSSEAIKTIVAHERIHVTQWHTIDILLVEICMVLYWFNPLAWLLRKAVKENLEFIADHEVLRSGADKKTYQYSLLHATGAGAQLPMTSQFNLIDLKQRILMMNKKRSSRSTLVRYILFVPSIIGFCLLLTISVTGSVTHLLQQMTTAAMPASWQEETSVLPVANSSGKKISEPKSSENNKVEKDPASTGVIKVPEDTNGEQNDTHRLTVQPVLTELKEKLYDEPSTDKLKPGQPMIQASDVENNGVVTVRNYPAETELAAKTNPGVKVNAKPFTEKIVQGYPMRRVQGFKFDQNTSPLDTGNKFRGIKIVQGFPLRP
jgi:hypothetical protein